VSASVCELYPSRLSSGAIATNNYFDVTVKGVVVEKVVMEK